MVKLFLIQVAMLELEFGNKEFVLTIGMVVGGGEECLNMVDIVLQTVVVN